MKEGYLDYLMIKFLLQISINSDINGKYFFLQACLFLSDFLINLCSELCGFSQTISIQIIHVSMYYLWRFFIHKLIRIPNFWSMRTRMREDADKDGASGFTSRMNKIFKIKVLVMMFFNLNFATQRFDKDDITDHILLRKSLILELNFWAF